MRLAAIALGVVLSAVPLTAESLQFGLTLDELEAQQVDLSGGWTQGTSTVSGNPSGARDGQGLWGPSITVTQTGDSLTVTDEPNGVPSRFPIAGSSTTFVSKGACETVQRRSVAEVQASQVVITEFLIHQNICGRFGAEPDQAPRFGHRGTLLPAVEELDRVIVLSRTGDTLTVEVTRGSGTTVSTSYRKSD